jgi:hypothetical protein
MLEAYALLYILISIHMHVLRSIDITKCFELCVGAFVPAGRGVPTVAIVRFTESSAIRYD